MHTYPTWYHCRKRTSTKDHGDAGVMISNNGQEYPLQIVFNVQEIEAGGDPWCPCR